MISLHEQVAPIAFAPPPIPLFEVPPLTEPADGKAFRALMVGGREHTHRDLEPALRDDWGIQLISTHWHADRARLPIEIPIGTEVMLIVTTVIGHELSNHARALAQKAKIPYIGISTKASSYAETLERHGLRKHPRWVVPKKPAARLVPIELAERARTLTESIDPFGQALVTVRKNANMSQRVLGEKLDVKHSRISQWESGISTPRFAMYRLMLEALPNLRSYPPPIALRTRVADTLVPSEEEIAKAAPPPPVLSMIAVLGVKYAEAVAEAERHKRAADEQMRQAETSMDSHKTAHERAEAIRLEILEHATKG